MSEIMDRLAEENPNIGEHLRDWQVARTQNNEDAYTWTAFREHEMAIGAPDPGETEPEEFRQYDWTKYAPSAEQKASEPPTSATMPASAPEPAQTSGGASGASAGASVGVTEPPHKAKKSLLDFLLRR